MSDGPGPGTVIAGLFLIMAGTCIVLVGGGCTVMVIGSLGDPYMGGGFGLLLLGASLLTLAFGAFLVWVGIKMLGGRDG